MRPSTKFAIGACVIVAAVSLMIYEGINSTGTYFFTPTELVTRAQNDSSYYNLGLKVSAKVVKGSIRKDPSNHRVDFSISDGTQTFPVTYTGPAASIPDTFTDENDIDVVVEGKFGVDRTFHATDVIAKCGSRYEPVMKQAKSS
jgi:cytochrome c-type biogenesis protein CcmE